MNPTQVEQAVSQWLEEVVIGLNLCPFAQHPWQQQQVRLHVCHGEQTTDLLVALYTELKRLESTPEAQLSTTLLIMPQALEDFYSFNDFLALAEALIDEQNWQGVFQLASFHPNYQFSGTQPQDAENLTNRAPYPIVHLLRENSLDKAIAHYPNTELIPTHNIATVKALSWQQKQALFPYLFAAKE